MPRFFVSSAGQSHRVTFWATIVLAFALFVLAGTVDYLTDVDVIIAPFYLLPITWAAWKLGNRAGYFFCALATATLLGTNMLQNRGFEARQLWNAGIWCSVFIAFTMLCVELKGLNHGFPVGRLLFKAFLVSAVPAGLIAASLLLMDKRPDRPAPRNRGQLDLSVSQPAAPTAATLLNELVRDIPQALQASRSILLGSRDLNGPSCVPTILAGDLRDTLPTRMADLDGGPGTKLALLLSFDRQQIKGPQEDFEWHQSRLKSFLQTESEANKLMLERARVLSEKALQLHNIIDSWSAWPSELPDVTFNQQETLPGYCLRSLTEAVHMRDLPQAKQWAAELASSIFALEDLHRWLGLLTENHMAALDFQQKCASLFSAADPAIRGKYDLNGSIGGFPAGGMGVNGIWNYYEVERQAERLFNIRSDQSGNTPTGLATGDDTWIAPGVRDCFEEMEHSFSPVNRRTWESASHTPYNRTYIVSMLFRMQKAGATKKLAAVLKRFDAAHPNATIPEMMDVLMYRGNGFAGLEWPDRFQPQLIAVAEQLNGSELDVFRMSHKLTNDFFRTSQYSVTLTLREALERNKLDCVRSTDMIGAIFRNAGQSGFANVRWSSETATHSVAALLLMKDGKPLTLLSDGMMAPADPEIWPDAYFNGHAWPERFKDNPPPYAVELNVRGLDNYLWAEGYIIRGPNAGTLQKAAIPYLPSRERTSTEKAFAGPYPN